MWQQLELQRFSILSAIVGRLQFEHLCVSAADPYQRLVRPLFDDCSILEDDRFGPPFEL